MPRTNSFYKYILTPSLLAFNFFAFAQPLNNEFEIAKNLEIYANVFREVNTNYMKDVDPQRTMRVGIEAMLKHLDPYTEYISPENAQVYDSQLSARYQGIGAKIQRFNDGKVYVTQIQEKSPAALYGLQLMDEIITINQKAVKNQSLRYIGHALRGTPNSSIDLRVKSLDNKKEKTLTIVRQNVEISQIPYIQQDKNGIVYIVVQRFTRGIGSELRSSLKKIQNTSAIKGIVLDLRNTPGGLLDEAVNICSIFLPKGSRVVQVKGKELSAQQTYRTIYDPLHDQKTPLAILINKHTASSAEVVAGAIQEYDRGLIIGQASHGKALVQKVVDLTYGAKLRITTAIYYLNSGRSIQAWEYKKGKVVRKSSKEKSAFKTIGGRTIYEGNGIEADMRVYSKELEELVNELEQKNIFQEFALQYKKVHPKHTAFKLTNADFEEFKTFIQKGKQQYHSALALKMKDIKTKAKKANISIEQHLSQLEQKLQKIQAEKLTRHQNEILHILQKHIGQLSFPMDEVIKKCKADDLYITKALSILSNQTEYKSILHP